MDSKEFTDVESAPGCGHPLPEPGMTIVHSLADLARATGPVWIPCMTNLLREYEESQSLATSLLKRIQYLTPEQKPKARNLAKRKLDAKYPSNKQP